MKCRECGREVMSDPDGSPGVFVHAEGDEANGCDRHDIDAHHVAIPDEPDDALSVQGWQQVGRTA